MTTRHELARYLHWYWRLARREARALRARFATRRQLQRENACLKAVNAALYQTVDTMLRAAVAAGVDVGEAEGTRRTLGFNDGVREILDGP